MGVQIKRTQKVEAELSCDVDGCDVTEHFFVEPSNVVRPWSTLKSDIKQNWEDAGWERIVETTNIDFLAVCPEHTRDDLEEG